MYVSTSHWFYVWRERAVAFDPGLTNLLLAARAAGSVALTLFVLFTFTQLTGQSPTLLLIGGAMAICPNSHDAR